MQTLGFAAAGGRALRPARPIRLRAWAIAALVHGLALWWLAGQRAAPPPPQPRPRPLMVALQAVAAAPPRAVDGAAARSLLAREHTAPAVLPAVMPVPAVVPAALGAAPVLRLTAPEPAAPVADAANAAAEAGPAAAVSSPLGAAAGQATGGAAGDGAAPAMASPAPSWSPPVFDADYLHNPPPDYPLASQRLGEHGRVLLRVHVSADGQAQEVLLQQSCGHTRLDEAARRAVQRWRFVPARQGAVAVAAWVLVPVRFTPAQG